MQYSIVIPTYNRRDLLTGAIDSVLVQACSDLEIIVVDDGSSDGTGRMIADRYTGVRYLSQVNQGPAAARNRGIAAARGELIAFLDSDDIWSENRISLETDLLRHFPGVAALAGNANVFVDGVLCSSDVFAQRGICFPGEQPRYFDWSIPVMKLGPVCCTSGLTLRRQTLEHLGTELFDETLRLDEDWDLEFRMFSHGKVLLYPQLACTRRIFDDGTRHFYSIKGKTKSAAEQAWIWAQQRRIILRYVNSGLLDAQTTHEFRRRAWDIEALLENLSCDPSIAADRTGS